jgi:hypothetical protein
MVNGMGYVWKDVPCEFGLGYGAIIAQGGKDVKGFAEAEDDAVVAELQKPQKDTRTNKRSYGLEFDDDACDERGAFVAFGLEGRVESANEEV